MRYHFQPGFDYTVILGANLSSLKWGRFGTNFGG